MFKIYIKKILLIVICLLCYFQSYSQSHVLKHYGVEDGLPSSEVYSAFQDSKGYMWFATDAGVSRFNGYEFENFDASDGLTDNTVFLIAEDSKGRIWFGTFNCKLSYYENASIYPYKYNDQLAKRLYGNSGIQSFYVDDQENIWLGFYKEGLYKCNKRGEITQTIMQTEKNEKIYKLLEIDKTQVWGVKEIDIIHGNKGLLPKLKCEIVFDGKETTIKVDRLYKKRWQNVGINYYKDNALLLLNDQVSLLKKDKTVQKINTEGISFFSNKRFFSVAVYNEFIWICVEKEGVYKCKIEDGKLIVTDHFLTGKSVARIFKDNREGIWFQTLGEGVYYLSSKKMEYTAYKNKITALVIDTNSGQKFIAFNNGDVVKTKMSTSDIKEVIINQKISPLTLKYNYNDSSLLLGGMNDVFEYYQNNQIHFITKAQNMVVKAFLIDDSLIYRVNGFGLSIIKNKKEVYNSLLEGEPKIWCTSLLKNKNAIWIGTKDGMRVYENKKITNPYKNVPYLSRYITCMERLNDEFFLVGTKIFGVLIVKNNQVIDVIDKTDGLLNNLVKDVHIDYNQTIWIATNKGISRINYKGVNDFELYNLTIKQGLISNEVTKIKSFRNIIYGVSPKGLIEFDKTKISINTVPPAIHVTGIEVNAVGKGLIPNLILPYDENFITVYFKGINYTNLGDIEYQYRMLGIDTTWSSTTIGSVKYPALQPNKFRFEVKAKNEDGYWSKPTFYSFTISPPFWKSCWFILSSIAFGLGVIYISFKVNVLAYNKHIQQEIINRILMKLGKRTYVLIEIDKKHIRINENSILFVEAFKNYVEINTTNKKHLYRSSMVNMESKLSSLRFVRTHRSFIVQKDKIDSIEKGELIVDNQLIPIGKTYQPKLKELRNQFTRLNS